MGLKALELLPTHSICAIAFSVGSLRGEDLALEPADPTKGRADLDPTTSWFVLAWDAFKAPVFSYDEGLRLARAVGADLEGQLIGRLWIARTSG